MERKIMEGVVTYCVKIYVGLRSDCSEKAFEITDVERICQEHVDEKELYITVTRTKFIYTKGTDDGVVVGLISHPQFLSNPFDIIRRAIELANILLEKLEQNHVLIVFQEETIMISREEE